MKRSPILLASFLLAMALLCISPVFGQTNPAAPKQGSGVPETPVPGTSANNPAPNAAPTNAQPSSATPATAPDATPPASSKQGPNGSEPSKPNSAQQQGTTQPGAAEGATGRIAAPVPSTPPGATAEPEQPKTEILDSSATSSGVVTTDGHDPVLDPAPLPDGSTTLVGGVVTGVDHVRNRMSLRVFGGGHWKVGFDERTHIFRNGAETTQLAIKKGERIYMDTMLDKTNHEIFARNIRLGVAAPPADADGQIVDLDTKHQTLTLRDQIDSVPVHFAVDQQTKITHGSSPASFAQIKPGSLVHVKFSPESPNRGLAREISIVAAPGSQFTFIGKVTFLDVHRGLLALQNAVDNKNYEIHFDAAKSDVKDQLAVGSGVRIVAIFEGTRYTAESINLTSDSESAEKQ